MNSPEPPAPSADEVIATPILRPALPDDPRDASDPAAPLAPTSDEASRDPRPERPSALSSQAQAGVETTFASKAPPNDPLENLSFMRDPPPGEAAGASRQWPHWVAICTLLFLLATQIGLQNRDRIAANAPALGFLLKYICRPLGCVVGPVRQISSIVIDSSAFNRLPNTGYRLQLTVRNQADIDLAMPDIELTLSSSQDNVLLRKVLAPADFGAPEILTANGEWAGAIAIALAGDIERVSGYRVFAFYR